MPRPPAYLYLWPQMAFATSSSLIVAGRQADRQHVAYAQCGATVCCKQINLVTVAARKKLLKHLKLPTLLNVVAPRCCTLLLLLLPLHNFSFVEPLRVVVVVAEINL